MLYAMCMKPHAKHEPVKPVRVIILEMHRSSHVRISSVCSARLHRSWGPVFVLMVCKIMRCRQQKEHPASALGYVIVLM